MRHMDSKTAGNSAKNANKAVSLGSLNTDRKRRASVSSVSSVSSIGESDGENDSEDDADDEEEPAAVRAPSYSHRREKALKAGRRSKKMRLFDDDFFKSGDEHDSDGSLDDVYAAVDYITDDDNEEHNVEKLEELLIVQSEDEQRFGGMMAASDAGNTDQWAGAEAFNDHMLLSGASFFDDEHLYGAMDTFGETGFASEAAAETPVPRHVHFEDHDSSSDSDSHTEDEIPSDFLHQDSLDPQLRRMIESDNDTNRNRRRQSDETFGDADYGHGNIYHAESDAVSEGGSGYESMSLGTCPPLTCMLTDFQPTTVKPQMKIFLRRQLSRIHDPSFAVTRVRRWLPLGMTKSSRLAADEGQSWARLSQIPTSRLPWWIAPASIS